MNDTIKTIYNKLFYDPYQVVKKDPRISIDPKAILLKSTRFLFQPSGGKLTVGADSMVGCNFFFESDQGEITIGERTYIGGGTNILSRSRVAIGSDVTIAYGVYIYDHDS